MAAAQEAENHGDEWGLTCYFLWEIYTWCYFYFATLWLGAFNNFGMWLDEQSWHHNC